MNDEEIINQINDTKVKFRAAVFEKIFNECEAQKLSEIATGKLIMKFAHDLETLIEKTVNLKQ
jgi:hypothetical protein